MDDLFRDIGNPDTNCSIDQILKDYFKTDGEPPEPSETTVYHYTSLAVLNEMCKDNGDFFATHFMSLNDTREFFLGVQIALEQLANCPTLPVKIRDNYPSFQSDARDNIVWLLRKEILSPWIVSFSKDPDSLSQWVAYTDRIQGGVAVGFDLRILQAAAKEAQARVLPPARISFHMTRCRYTDESDLPDRIIRFFKSVTTRPGFGRLTTMEQKRRLVAAVFLCAASIKHKSFSQEKEFRLVLLPSSSEVFRRYRFLGGKPRIKTDLFMGGNHLAQAISSIVISPQGDHRKLVTTVNLLRRQHNLKFPVFFSTSSYNGQ